MRVRTLSQAAKFVDRVGFAYVFPDNRMPLPSLWGAVTGDPWREMHEEDWGWTKAVALAWDFKDALGGKRLAWFGRYFRGKGSLVSLEMLPALRAIAADRPVSPLGLRALERLRHVGPMSSLRLRESLALDRPRFDKVLLELYRAVAIANVGSDDTETRWPSAVIGAVDRVLGKARPVRDARARLEERMRRTAPEITPRQLRALLRT